MPFGRRHDYISRGSASLGLLLSFMATTANAFKYRVYRAFDDDFNARDRSFHLLSILPGSRAVSARRLSIAFGIEAHYDTMRSTGDASP